MRPVSVLTGAALSIAALGLSTPASFAQSDISGASVSLSPPTARPGMMVEVRVDCSAFASPSPTGVSSPGFKEGQIRLKPTGQEGRFWGEATAVNRPGTYQVSGACTKDTDGSSRFSGTLTVSAGGPSPAPSTPTGPMRTGIGGSSSNGTPVPYVAGAVALAVATAGGTWFLRRRNENRS
ncbi:hypothetical protein [Streptomyces gobiensis]|uniref:hypothetical protein n=1 Tax=Streptomyces gobiensis TaxID=2875706 RepID=UPI001E4B9B57|nr:hypothetical protein [Streptomyces gobiensis]UGY90698.1 hypothetical protein test1122_02460 [Streptomyces gobiensis]